MEYCVAGGTISSAFSEMKMTKVSRKESEELSCDRDRDRDENIEEHSITGVQDTSCSCKHLSE
jgi:hypothetical protein